MKIENNPLVSVVIPCYNADKYIEESLRSIMTQSYTNLEIIVINDGSIDDTKSILLNLAKEDARIVYVENNKNIKLVKTLNKGVSISNGIYIARMDADDIALVERIEKQVEYLIKNPEVAVLGSAVDIFGKSVKSKKKQQPLNDNEIKSKMFVASPFHHPTVIFNMNAISKDEIFYDNNYHRIEDYELWMRLMIRGYKFANLKEALLKYRILENSESKIFNKQLVVKNSYLKKIFVNFFNELNISLDEKEIEDYVLTLNKASFSLISIKRIELIFDKLLFDVSKYSIRKYISLRWVAYLIYGNKKEIFKNPFKPIANKYTLIGVFYYLKKYK